MLDIRTDRLYIRNFKADDWEDLFEYLSQKEVLRYEPGSESDQDDCKKMAIERSRNDVFLAVCLKDTDTMIGHIYFNLTNPTDFLTWEIGYIFNPKYYGKGFATEACKRVLQFGFEELDAHRIIGICDPENTASWKLLERLFMRREGYYKKKAFFRRTADGEPIWHDAYEYAILAEEWRTNK